jgi:hypothetical protein
MKDDSKQRLDQDVGEQNGQGSSKKTGAGAEASEGIHSGDGSRSETDRSALEGKESGTESIESHDTEHRSKYGGGSRREDGGGQRTP